MNYHGYGPGGEFEGGGYGPGGEFDNWGQQEAPQPWGMNNNVVQHEEEDQENNEENVAAGEEEDEFRRDWDGYCHLCSQGGFNKLALTQHQEAEHSRARFPCMKKNCNRMFYTRNARQEHMNARVCSNNGRQK